MQPIRDVLNRIQWDPHEKPEDYTICYHDRVSNQIKTIRYTDIDRLDHGFMVIKGEPPTTIPLHRVRLVFKNKNRIWQRPAPAPAPTTQQPTRKPRHQPSPGSNDTTHPQTVTTKPS